jgi:hypothetical protein
MPCSPMDLETPEGARRGLQELPHQWQIHVLAVATRFVCQQYAATYDVIRGDTCSVYQGSFLSFI